MSDQTFGGNATVSAGKPIWQLARENNQKQVKAIRMMRGVIVHVGYR